MTETLCDYNDRDIVWLQWQRHCVITMTETLCDYNDTMIVMSSVVIVTLCDYFDGGIM